MQPRMLPLIALLATLVCGLSGQATAAVDDRPRAPEPTGWIQVEVKGVLVCKKIGKAYVSVRHKDGKETRVWFWESEGAWKSLKNSLPKLDGQVVTVRGQIRQHPEKSRTSIPNQALYFRSSEIVTKAGERIR